MDTKLRCLSLSPWVCSNSHLLSQWCHPTISSSVTPCPQSFPSIQVFSNESTLPVRGPRYWSFSFSIIFSSRNKCADLFLGVWVPVALEVLVQCRQTSVVSETKERPPDTWVPGKPLRRRDLRQVSCWRGPWTPKSQPAPECIQKTQSTEQKRGGSMPCKASETMSSLHNVEIHSEVPKLRHRVGTVSGKASDTLWYYWSHSPRLRFPGVRQAPERSASPEPVTSDVMLGKHECRLPSRAEAKTAGLSKRSSAQPRKV